MSILYLPNFDSVNFTTTDFEHLSYLQSLVNSYAG